ncbi:MAG: hypothetical protein JWN40_5660 [Phycisphaerales bacterium]|jgi:hypothetical protein|nr:hypothetical protein [Phycisphaerales bacterium]
MSYYTHVDFAFSDEPPPAEIVLAAARTHLEARNLYAVDAVLSDLSVAWQKGSTDFNGLVSQDVEALMKSVSKACPDLKFIVRGAGEEMRDIWVREIEGGEVVYSIGPFDEE